MKKSFAGICISIFIASCTQAPEPEPSINQTELNTTVFFGGPILTMVGDQANYAEAIVVKNDKIDFIGSKADALSQAGMDFSSIDLEGRTLMPGFIDGHAHFANFGAQAIGVQLLPPPDAGAKDVATIISLLQEWNTPANRELTGWIFGTGFDDSVITEKRFLTKHDLDQVTTEFPVMITHISGHFAVVNSKGLELLGIDADTPNPEGGIIRREPDSLEPNGVLEELAAIQHMLKAISPTNEASFLQFFEAGQEMALSFGYTTAHEGRAMSNHEFLANMAEQNRLKLDVVSYIDYLFVDQYMDSKWNSKEYINGYKIGGMKITLDGSPQGRTAWRTMPYLLPPDGADEGYLGYPSIPNDQDVIDIYEKAFVNNWQILTHANGDAAMDQMIRALGTLQEKYGNDDRRFVLIHGQYIREDQLDAFKSLDVITSLFPLHTFYWGDWHSEIIGAELAQKISPVRTALNKGLNITLHTDAPVALPNLMRVVWTAVSRTSRSGKVIGEQEKLTPYEALQAITIWSAYQHFEEDRKGSLEVGKLADLVILDANPIDIPIDSIKDVQVVQTFKAGNLVYSRN
ncbi:amidohydrolase [Glaciecola sp. SC05]|uniref:amidohydrolase n=1 Tax=Glaciecola sp. SC05 TaxID=1987355 RepID=UPI003529A41B